MFAANYIYMSLACTNVLSFLFHTMLRVESLDATLSKFHISIANIQFCMLISRLNVPFKILCYISVFIIVCVGFSSQRSAGGDQLPPSTV